jgi:outer membrane protein assembly factor BamE (lipoprotein component of BamABCDE complex)
MAGCAVTVDNRGNAPDPELVEQIRPGKQNREQVVRMIGTPSTVATFDQETWYYISARTSTTAFKKTKLQDRQILTIRFNKQGVVAEITKFDASHGRLVTLVNRKTPTKGKELTIIQQLVGNVGRFSAPGNSPDRAGY